MSHLPELEGNCCAIGSVMTGRRGIDLLGDCACTVRTAGPHKNVECQSTEEGTGIDARMPRESLVLNRKKQVNQVRWELQFACKPTSRYCERGFGSGVREQTCDPKNGATEAPHDT